ncbi:N-6 DNA methylase [Sorangium sp. So ce861]|uniref:N-6 DNA methylase n=1 Tax=Sorangium sp. So ce861 TaxID=3133323 RepID=UPI003F5FCAE5
MIALDGIASGHEQLQYLDLLPRRSPSPPPLPISAVAEHQGLALLYLVDVDPRLHAAAAASKLSALQRELANRSDPAWIGLVRPGSLEIYPIGFHVAGVRPIKVIRDRDPDAPLFFQNLVHGTFSSKNKAPGVDEVYNRIFELLTQTIDEFVPHGRKIAGRQKGKSSIAPSHRAEPLLDPLLILSLAGRALFFRFLIDRAIVVPDERADICPFTDDLKDAFSNATNAASTSAWLDETFNGDFLRVIDEQIPVEDREARRRAYRALYIDIGRQTDGVIFKHLQAILRGWKHVGGGAFQIQLDWDEFNFAHIPIGVLSQVYESFSHRADSKVAESQSVHYTPRTIARLLVNEVFTAAENPADAVVLDPACGAGIFLALAFRRLVQERWRRDGRPTTGVIKQILYQQLRGFDVSEPALRLAALTLYITAIEVNGSPRPPAVLKFPRNLRGEVLFHFGDDTISSSKRPKSPQISFVLGSLGDRVPHRFNKYFDIVLSNPPWTRLREEEPQEVEGRAERKEAHHGHLGLSDAINAEFTKIGQSALRDRGLDDLLLDYKNPDKNPDVPFLWRATQWAKDGGLIAMVLHSRIFQRTTEPEAGVWRAVLRATSVTGLINFADLRKTAVWQGIDVPYCLLFLRNERSLPEHRFYYSAPSFEPKLNRHGRFRIDYESSRLVSVEYVIKHPWVLKSLSLGTWLDVDVVERIFAAFPLSLKQVWTQLDPERKKTGEGYALGPRLKQSPLEFLGDLEDFQRPPGFEIPVEKYNTFFVRYGRGTANRPRSEDLYKPPLLIVPQAPGDDPQGPRAWISSRALAFSQSFYGYSCADLPEQDTLAALLYLMPHSAIFEYFLLMTSRRVGFDRQTFNKQEFDAIPFPDVSTLDSEVKTKIRDLARRLERDVAKPWGEIDSLLFHIYGLDDDAAQVVRDTLFASVSYRQKGRDALEPPRNGIERNVFRSELRDILEPYFAVCGQRVAIEDADLPQDAWRSPWLFVAISSHDEALPIDADLLSVAMEEADKLAASRIIVRAPEHRGLLLGILSQRRWWTRTRARLCGQHIIRHHLDVFASTEDV